MSDTSFWRQFPAQDRVTPAVLRILALILTAAQRGEILTLREIVKAIGQQSTSRVLEHVRKLEQLGLVEREVLTGGCQKAARTLRPLYRFEMLPE